MSRQFQERKLENQQKILKAAMAMFRKKGYAAAGVDGIMEAAGLTHGGFYGHFKSKSDLLVKTFVDAGARAAVLLEGGRIASWDPLA